jgi:hypothetical protein
MNSKASSELSETRLRGWRLAVVRLVWVGIALVGVGSFVVRLPGHHEDLQRVCSGLV